MGLFGWFRSIAHAVGHAFHRAYRAFHGVSSFFRHAASRARHVVSAYRGFYHRVGRRVHNAFHHAFNRIRSYTHAFVSHIHKAVHNMVNGIRSAGRRISHWFHRTVHNISRSARRFYHSARNLVSSAVSHVRNYVHRIVHHFKHIPKHTPVRSTGRFIRHNPWVVPAVATVLIGAAVVGSGVGVHGSVNESSMPSSSGNSVGVGFPITDMDIFNPIAGSKDNLFWFLMGMPTLSLGAAGVYLWNRYRHVDWTIEGSLPSDSQINDPIDQGDPNSKGLAMFDPIETKEEWEKEVESYKQATERNPIYKPWKDFAMGIVQLGDNMNSLGDQWLDSNDWLTKAGGVLEKFSGGVIESIGGVIDFPNEVINAGSYAIAKEIAYSAGWTDDPLTPEEMGIAVGDSFVGMGEHFWNEFHDDPINALGEVAGLWLTWEAGKAIGTETRTAYRTYRVYKTDILDKPVSVEDVKAVWVYSREWDPLYPPEDYLKVVKLYKAKDMSIPTESGEIRGFAVLRKGVHYGEHSGFGWEHIWQEELRTGRFHNYYLEKYGIDLKGAALKQRMLEDMGEALEKGTHKAIPGKNAVVYRYNDIKVYVSTKSSNLGSVQTARPDTGD